MYKPRCEYQKLGGWFGTAWYVGSWGKFEHLSPDGNNQRLSTHATSPGVKFRRRGSAPDTHVRAPGAVLIVNKRRLQREKDMRIVRRRLDCDIQRLAEEVLYIFHKVEYSGARTGQYRQVQRQTFAVRVGAGLSRPYLRWIHHWHYDVFDDRHIGVGNL